MARKEVTPAANVELPKPGGSIEAAKDSLDKLFNTADVGKVYARPIKHGDAIIIPAAEVIAVAGFGFGQGFGAGDVPSEEGVGTGAGEGGGGGVRTFSRPVAVVISTPEGIRIEPVFDRTKIFMAAATAIGFMAAMLMRFISPRRALRELQGK